MKTPKIYIAGPYRAATPEGVDKNIEKAREYGLAAVIQGWNALTPHLLFAGMDRMPPKVSDEKWLALTMDWLRECDAVYLVPGWENSAGTLAEIEKAKRLGLPIYKDGELPPAATFMFARAERKLSNALADAAKYRGAGGNLKPLDPPLGAELQELGEVMGDEALGAAIERTAQSLSFYGDADSRGAKLLLNHLNELQKIEFMRASAVVIAKRQS